MSDAPAGRKGRAVLAACALAASAELLSGADRVHSLREEALDPAGLS